MKTILNKDKEWLIWLVAFGLTSLSVILHHYKYKEFAFWSFVLGSLGLLTSIIIMTTKKIKN